MHCSRAKPNIIHGSRVNKILQGGLPCRTKDYMAHVPNQISHMAQVSNQIYMAHVQNQILHGSCAEQKIARLTCQTKYYWLKCQNKNMVHVPNWLLHGSRAKPNITWLSYQPNITWLTCQTEYYISQEPNRVLYGSHAKLNITWLTCQNKYSSRLPHVKLFLIIGSRTESNITLGSRVKLSIHVILRIIVLELYTRWANTFKPVFVKIYRYNLREKSLRMKERCVPECVEVYSWMLDQIPNRTSLGH